ncbi:MAG: insulinase family protein, partial [Lentisphaeria bacterium]|nr:insulinase family protein [Lentisphaeria bacterium]
MNYLGNTQEYVLDNGFRICHFRRPGPAVEIQIWVKTGSIHEDAYLGCGLSHFLEHMLFQGSRNYPGHAITDRVTAMGGTLNACTSYDHTSYRF